MSATLRYTEAHNLTLSGPAFGDACIKPNKVKLHLTMAGTIVSTKRTTDTADRLVLVFDNLTIDQYNDLSDLIHAANGDIINYSGPHGLWYVRVMNNPFERISRNASRYSVTLELVGQRGSTAQFIRLQSDDGYLLLQSGSYLLYQTEH